jgi:hypothetical protein
MDVKRGKGASKPRRLGSALSIPAALALLLAAAGWVVSPLPARWLGAGRPWLASALGSDLFVACALICIAGIGVLAVVLTVLWRIGRSRRRRHAPDSGVILVEFILLLPILLTVSLMILQAALLMSGLFAVNYSAWCAARTAAVQIPTRVDASEPANVLVEGGVKFGRIFRSAIWPLVPVGNGGSWVEVTVDDRGLVDELARFYRAYDREVPGWVDERLARKLSYVWDHTRVRVAAPENGARYGANEDIRVTVEHTYYLSVPYAGWMVQKLSVDGVDLDTADADHGLRIRASASLINWGRQDWVDQERFD